MQYQFISQDRLLIVKLSGAVCPESWRAVFTEAEQAYIGADYSRFLVDGSGLTGFNIDHSECQKLARGFMSFARKGAFFSQDPLVFGMMRVIHSYSNNEQFKVFKTSAQAMAFLLDHSPDCVTLAT